MSVCKYHKEWGCTTEATKASLDGFCLPHAMLYMYLVFGPGDGDVGTKARLAAHDLIAGYPSAELERLLRSPEWEPSIIATFVRAGQKPQV